MDPKFQTSFIPKKVLTGGGTVSTGINRVSLVASLIFFVALTTSVGLYFYSNFLDTQIATSFDSLKKAEDAFDPATIASLVRLDARIEATDKILKSHIAVTPLFETLEKMTLRSIRFSNLVLTFGGLDKITLAMDGQALSYEGVAYQSDVITQNSLIKNPIFSDLNLDASGNITFKFSSTLNPILTSYTQNLTNTAEEGDDATPAPISQ